MLPTRMREPHAPAQSKVRPHDLTRSRIVSNVCMRCGAAHGDAPVIFWLELNKKEISSGHASHRVELQQNLSRYYEKCIKELKILIQNHSPFLGVRSSKRGRTRA